MVAWVLDTAGGRGCQAVGMCSSRRGHPAAQLRRQARLSPAPNPLTLNSFGRRLRWQLAPGSTSRDGADSSCRPPAPAAAERSALPQPWQCGVLRCSLCSPPCNPGSGVLVWGTSLGAGPWLWCTGEQVGGQGASHPTLQLLNPAPCSFLALAFSAQPATSLPGGSGCPQPWPRAWLVVAPALLGGQSQVHPQQVR